MDKETVNQIAQELAAILHADVNFIFWFQLIAVPLLAALGTWGGSYLRERGRNLATKSDFKTLLNHLRQNTELVESVKSAISLRDWQDREWRAAQSKALLEILELIERRVLYLEKARKAAFNGEITDEPDLMARLSGLGTLYFPELSIDIARFNLAVGEASSRAMELAQEVFKNRGKPESVQAAEAFNKANRELHPQVLYARNDLEASCRKMAEQIFKLPSSGQLTEKDRPTIDVHRT